MRTLLGDALFGENQDPAGIADGGKAVGDHKGGAILRQFFQALLHHPLAFIIQRAGGFIKDQNRRVFQKDPGNGKPLLLPAGEFDAPLTDIAFITIGQREDKFMGIGFFRRFDDFVIGGIREAVANILHNGTGEQVNILLHHADLIP